MGRLGLLLLLGGSVLWGQDVESLHQFNGFFKPSDRLTLQSHLRVRTNGNMSSFFQIRGGPIAYFAVKPRLSLIGGYYYIGQSNRTHDDIDEFHRAFGGVQVVLLKTPKLTLESRTLVERFISTPSGDFARGRQRLLVQKQGKGLLPYFSVEGLMVAHRGTVRVGVGVLQQMSPQLQMLMGYEMRQYTNGRVAHVLVSNLQFVQQRPR
ncbi:MAG: DUF2490 domain-containing protein [Acidobacteria bacterium]|nr:DUF2490 domain-containing protein [Acidobacteriota bacterium]